MVACSLPLVPSLHSSYLVSSCLPTVATYAADSAPGHFPRAPSRSGLTAKEQQRATFEPVLIGSCYPICAGSGSLKGSGLPKPRASTRAANPRLIRPRCDACVRWRDLGLRRSHGGSVLAEPQSTASLRPKAMMAPLRLILAVANARDVLDGKHVLRFFSLVKFGDLRRGILSLPLWKHFLIFYQTLSAFVLIPGLLIKRKPRSP